MENCSAASCCMCCRRSASRRSARLGRLEAAVEAPAPESSSSSDSDRRGTSTTGTSTTGTSAAAGAPDGSSAGASDGTSGTSAAGAPDGSSAGAPVQRSKAMESMAHTNHHMTTPTMSFSAEALQEPIQDPVAVRAVCAVKEQLPVLHVKAQAKIRIPHARRCCYASVVTLLAEVVLVLCVRCARCA